MKQNYKTKARWLLIAALFIIAGTMPFKAKAESFTEDQVQVFLNQGIGTGGITRNDPTASLATTSAPGYITFLIKASERQTAVQGYNREGIYVQFISGNDVITVIDARSTPQGRVDNENIMTAAITGGLTYVTGSFIVEGGSNDDQWVAFSVTINENGTVANFLRNHCGSGISTWFEVDLNNDGSGRMSRYGTPFTNTALSSNTFSLTSVSPQTNCKEVVLNLNSGSAYNAITHTAVTINGVNYSIAGASSVITTSGITFGNIVSTAQTSFSVVVSSSRICVANNTVTLTIPSYTNPTSFSASLLPCDKTIQLSWTMPAYNATYHNSSQAFTIYRSENGGAYTALGSTVAFSTTITDYTYTDASITNGNTYKYRIIRHPWGVNCEYKETAEITANLSHPAPPIPTIEPQANNNILIHWATPGSLCGNSNIKLLIQNVSNGSEQIKNITKGETSYMMTSVQQGVKYVFVLVYVTDQYGEVEGLPSRSIIIFDPLEIGSELDVSKGYYANRISLVWASPKATPIEDWEIYRRELPAGGFTQVSRFSNSKASVIVYDDNSAQSGIMYEYRVNGITNCADTVFRTPEIKAVGFRQSLGMVMGSISYGSSGTAVPNVEVIAEVLEPNPYIGNGTSMAFNGNSYMEIPVRTTFINPNQFTVQFYIKPSGDNTNKRVFYKPNEFEILINNAQKLRFGVGSNANLYMSDTLPNDVFTHITAVFDKTASVNNLKIYTNGKLTDSLTQSNITFSGNNTLYVGSLGTNTTYRFTGYLDDIRIWRSALSKEDIEFNYSTVLSGKEPDLGLYIRGEEGIDSLSVSGGGTIGEMYDISYVSYTSVYNSNHAKTYNVKLDKNTTPIRSQLGLKGKTDANGTYTISAIPYAGLGTTYRITPMFDVHSFKPSSKSLYIGENNLIYNEIDFEDISSFTVWGKILYEGTTVPVDGVSFVVDGVNPSMKDGKLITTDANGEYQIEVPIGWHFITAQKQGHTFTVLRGDANNYVTNDRFPADTLTRYDFQAREEMNWADNTKVELIGRFVGGPVEGGKPVGFAVSKNNVGVTEIRLELANKNGLLSPDVSTIRTDTSSNGKIISRQTIYPQLMGNYVSVFTDENTGEFVAWLLPEDYRIKGGEVSALNNSANRVNYTSIINMKINRETVYLYDTDTTTAEKPVSNNEYEQDTTQKVITDSLQCNQKLNLVYRVSPTIEVLDPENRDAIFGERRYIATNVKTGEVLDTLPLINNGQYVFHHPAFAQFGYYSMEVSVFEEYINMDVTPNVSDRVPTVDGTMIADNDFSTNEFPNKIALNKKGQARYAFIVSTPNITANPLNAAQNYLKNLNIRVEFTDGTPTKTWAGSFSAYVLGALSNGNNFTTKGPKMVDLILRDPPGSKSYAWIEEGSSVTKTHEWGGAAETMADLTTEWKMGLAVKTFAGVGTGVINESMAINGNSAGLHTTQKGGRDNTTSTTYTFTEKIQTSAESDYVGAEADIFVGVAYNIVFGEAMMIDIYSQTSVNDPTPDSIVGTSGNVYRVGANRGMVFAPEFETEFIYTQGHIKNSVIPNLEKIRNDYFAYYYTEAPTVNNTNSPMYISKLLPSETGYGSNNTDSSLWGMIFRNTYNNYPQIISDPVNTPSYYILCPQSWLAINPDTLATDSIMFFNNEIQGWKNVLAQNEQEKVKAEKLRNVSFDAGAIYETTDTYDSLSGHTSYYEGSVDLHGGSDFGVDINETGVLFKLSVSETGSWYDRDGEENKTSLTFGYHLEDTDPSDYHTIDILKPTNNSTVFKLLGGQTSCPYEDEIIAEYFEPNKNHVLQQATAKVQDPEMAVNTPFIGNVPGNRSANFSLQVGNRSLVSTAWYMLTVDEKTNPNGLILSIDGEPIANGRIFSFDPTESFMKTLSVKRSRQDVTRYDNIHLILSSTCQSDLFDEVYISVEFLPSCSDLVLERPVNNQIMNLVTTDEAEFVVSEYDVKYNLFNHIVLEYKPATENQYIPFAYYYKDSAAYYAETDIQADRKAVIGDDNVIRRMWKAPVSDGQYMLRARSVCPAGAALTYESMSEEPLLIKDMVAPVPFGTPQPEDGILSIGDDLLLTFNEDIQPDYTYRITIQGELNGEELLHNAGLYFDGVNDVVEVNQPMNLEGKSFTVELWTIREGTAKNAVLFSHGTEDNKFEFGLTQNDEVWVNMNGNTVTSTLPLSTIAISWTHIAAVYTAPAGTAQGQIEVYVNGNNTPAIPATDVGTYSATGVISVGSDLERTSFYNGRANELRIWTKALSASQIYIQMNNKLSGTEVGLSAYWQMDEARGSLVNEKIRGRNGTTNATWFVLPAGRSLSFDGNNQYARTQILPEIESTADFSVEFWFRADESNSNACLFSTGRGDNQDYEPLNNKYFSVYFDGSKDLILRSANHAEVIASQLADGDWHHFALSVNRRSNANIYVDYNLQKAVHSSDYFGMFSGVNLWLGAMGWVKSFAGDDSVANFFKGNIDDLRIWRSALTQEGIRIAASSRLKGDEIGLRAYYPFDTTETATLIHGTLCDQVIESVSLSEEVTPNAAFTLFNGADFSTTAANIKPIRRLRNVQYSRVYNSSQIYLSLEEPMSSIENCILEISVQDVKDMHGNYLASPVKWTAFIDQNHLKWSEEHFSFVKDVFEPLSFKVTVLNKSGLGQTFSIENMPAWLTVSPSMGTIPPTGSVEITFTVNEGLNIGIYDENIYLRNSNGFNELLSIDLRVTGEEPDWSVNPSLYDYSMNIFGELNIKGIVSTDPEDMLAAFDGNTCVGVAKLRYVPEYDRYLAFLNVYGNTSNVALSFKIWDASAGIIYPMVLPDTLKFVENSYYGTARAPITFRALNYVEQLIPLNAGWNWISKNVTTPGMTSVNAAFVNNSFTANDRLKSQFNGHDEYVSSVWAGTISASGGMSSTQMYMLKVATAKTLTIVGEPVNPTTENVTVYPGWTWIGFTPQINLSLNEAFAGLNPHDGDLVKSQSAFSVYYEGTGGWLGTLNYMTPGTGYLYYGLNQDTVSFNYPAVSSLSSNRKSLGQDFADYKNAEDDILRSNYQSNLTLIARLQAEELTETDAEIKCYVGNDCRGTGKLVYVADKKAYFYFITVSGNVEGEMLSFSLQTETGEVISLKERLPYNGNQLYGTIDNPVVFTLGSEENTLKAYPNPFHSELTLTYTLTEEETGTIDFNITDITGKTLVSFSQTHAKAGYYTLSLQDKMTVLSSGIYMISMTSSTGKQMIKVVKSK